MSLLIFISVKFIIIIPHDNKFCVLILNFDLKISKLWYLYKEIGIGSS